MANKEITNRIKRKNLIEKEIGDLRIQKSNINYEINIRLKILDKIICKQKNNQ